MSTSPYLLVLQALLEPLPISSSGHLLLFEHAYALDLLPEFLAFAAHIPTALAAPVFFKKPWQQYLHSWKKMRRFALILVPATVITLAAYGIRDALPHYTLATGFVLTSAALLSCTLIPAQSTPRAPLYVGIALGGAQAAALLLPGLSRFAATFAAARWCGQRGNDAFALSFALQWPLLLAAGSKGAFESYLHGMLANFGLLPCLLGIGITAIISYYLFKIIDLLIARNLLWIFGVYTLIPALYAFWRT